MAQRTRTDIGVALSGGGHRAALFSAGALLALVDMGVARKTVSVASVSGGSITNGLIAQGCDLRNAKRHTLEAALIPGIKVFAHDGLFLPGKPTNRYVLVAFLSLGVALGGFVGLIYGVPVQMGVAETWNEKWSYSIVAVLLAVATLVAARSLPGRFRIAFLVGTLGGAFALARGMKWLDESDTATLWIAKATASNWWRGETGLASWLVVLCGFIAVTTTALAAIVILDRRSKAIDAAMHRYLFGEANLTSLQRHVHHVFCTTDLLTAKHGYLSSRMIYSYDWGVGDPSPSLRLSTVVQASACFPGGFPPRRLPASKLTHDPLNVTTVELIDGGVYDNMGDEWELGWEDRDGRYGDELCNRQELRAGTLLVVNAGGVWQPSHLPSWGLRREVASLAACSGIQHAITTTLRRRLLIRQFRNAQAGELTGALVHIDQTPQRVPDIFKEIPEYKERADAAIVILEKLGIDEVKGTQIRDRSTGVGTVLSPIPPDTAANLMWHAYLLARINAHVLLGWPLDVEKLDEWKQDRFERLSKLEMDPSPEAGPESAADQGATGSEAD